MLACLNDLNFNYTMFDAVDGRLEQCPSSSQSITRVTRVKTVSTAVEACVQAGFDVLTI